MQERIYNMLIAKDEITWQTIILDLIKTEQMNPWDIDISLLTKKYLERIKELKEANFFISGKMLLAAALLLRIKSYRLVDEDIANLDNVLFPKEEPLEEIDDFEDHRITETPKLAIKSPLARKRKVNIKDLIEALKKALDVSKRKEVRRLEELNFKAPEIPEKKVDISKLIKDIYERILDFFKKKEAITFDELVNSDKREDKLLTLIPLLHLDNQLKITIHQEKPFEDIYIKSFSKD